MLVMGVAPILAPLGGGLLLDLFGWSSIFHGLMLFSALCLGAVLLWLPETRSAELPAAPLSGALGRYRHLLGDRLLIGHGLTGGVAMAGMFAYISGSPYVFIELYGVPAEHYGWLFGANATGFILTAQFNGWLLRYHGPDYWIRRTVWVYCVATLALLAVAISQARGTLAAADSAVHQYRQPVLRAAQCHRLRHGRAGAHAGSASALIGSLQFTVAAGASALVGALHDGSALPMALVIALCGLTTLTLGLLTARHARHMKLEL